jgi:ATP-binding cassette, subfamily B, bacterial
LIVSAIFDYTPVMVSPSASNAPKGAPRSLSGLLPFLRPYRVRIALALLFLVLAAAATLLFPLALRSLIDGGLVPQDKGSQVMALREHFAALFGVAVALGLFSAVRFYLVSWLGERVTADLRNAVYNTSCGKARSSSRPPRPVRCSRV